MDGELRFREFPVFVPAGEERLCGVVCGPQGPGHDLAVVLLTGGNFTRTHTNRMWVRAARELADRGFPSIRLDYHGVGDSTGVAHYHQETPFDDDVLAAAGFLLRATGATRLALVATCFGGRSALAAAARHPGVAALTVYPIPVLVPGGRGRVRVRTRVKRWLRGRSWGERLLHRGSVRRARSAAATRRTPSPDIVSPRLKRDLAAVLRRGAEVRFVYGELDPTLPGLRRCLEEVDAALPAERRGRAHLEVIEGVDLHRYARLDVQDLTVDRAVRSVEDAYRSLADPGSVPSDVKA